MKEVTPITERELKRLSLKYYIAGIETESHWNFTWRNLSYIGRYRRLKEFAKMWETD